MAAMKIYVLAESDGKIRYIGKTILSLDRRLSNHLTEGRRGVKNRRCNWIRSVLSRGCIPRIQLIGEVEGDGCKEEIAWIEYFKNEGVDLVNGTNGGDGVNGWKPSKEIRTKISQALRGCIRSEETRRKIGEASRGRIHSETTRRKISEANRGRIPSRETRLKLSESHKNKPGFWKGKKRFNMTGEKHFLFGKHQSLEVRRKMSMARRGRTISTETRQKLSSATKKYWEKKHAGI